MVKVLSVLYLKTPIPELATAAWDYSLVQAAEATALSHAQQVAVISATAAAVLVDHSLALQVRSPAEQITSEVAPVALAGIVS
jgi:hypothetical protein